MLKKEPHLFKIEIFHYTITFMINLTHPCRLKVLISLQKDLADRKLLDGCVYKIFIYYILIYFLNYAFDAL